MVNCSFCNNEISKGTGKLYIRKDGGALRFCSSKCQKNMLVHNRKALVTEWTKTYNDVKKANKK